MPAIRTAVAVAASAAVLLLAAAPAGAASPIDQQMTSVKDGCADIGLPDPTPVTIGESFTAGRTGTLDQIDVYLGRDAAPTPFAIELHPVVDGVPTGAVITSASLPASSVPASGHEAFVAFPVPATPVVKGTQYAFVVGRGDASVFSICGSGADAYKGGEAGGFGGSAPPGEWQSLHPTDFAFRTHVTGTASANPLQPVLDGLTTTVQGLVCGLQAVLGQTCT